MDVEVSMAERRIIGDSVCKVVQGGDLTRTLGSLKTQPGAPNPFVQQSNQGQSVATPARPANTQSVKSGR